VILYAAGGDLTASASAGSPLNVTIQSTGADPTGEIDLEDSAGGILAKLNEMAFVLLRIPLQIGFENKIG
jgi:hypothetical protein